MSETLTSTQTPKTEMSSSGFLVRHGAFSFISAVCVVYVKGLIYISAVVSCLRRWNSSCFADQDKHDKNSSCTIHLEATLLVPQDCEAERGWSCASSRTSPAGQRASGRPVGLGGEAGILPGQWKQGAAPLLPPECAGVRSGVCAQGVRPLERREVGE